MRGKKVLATIFDKTQIINISSMFQRNVLIVINYHRIYQDTIATKFDKGVFTHSVDDFEKQMKWLKHNADFLSEDDVIYFAKHKKSFPRRCILITFDDGYKDNYKLVFPILKYLNIPAIFFIPTKAIINRELGWWDMISYFINNSSKKSIIIHSEKIAIEHHCEKDKAIKYLLHVMKISKRSDTKNLLKILAHECDVDFPTRTEQSKQLMSWDEIREVSTQNIAIGSHTHTHKVLSSLSNEEQLKELRLSKSLLEEKLNEAIKSVAYPVGGSLVFTEQTKTLAQLAGYEIGFSFNTGINHSYIIDKFDIKRIYTSHNFSIFKSTITLLPGFV